MIYYLKKILNWIKYLFVKNKAKKEYSSDLINAVKTYQKAELSFLMDLYDDKFTKNNKFKEKQ